MRESSWYDRWLQTCHESQIEPKMMEWVKQYCDRQEDGTWRARNPERVHTNNPRRRTQFMRKSNWTVYKVRKVRK